MHSTRFIIAFLCFLFLLPAEAQTTPSSTPVSPKTCVRVLGLVHVSGSFEWHPGMRLLDALAISGGLSSSPGDVRATLVMNGGRTQITIHLPALLNGDPKQNLLLEPGDILFLASADYGDVDVSGAVKYQSSHNVSKNGMTAATLLMLAGGPTPDAALSQAQVRQENQSRTYDLRTVPGAAAQTADTLRLFPGDNLIIPTRKTIFIYGAVYTPGRQMLPDDEPLTVAQAIAASGGPKPDALSSKIYVIRPSAGRTDNRIFVGMNDPLQARDILVVPSKLWPPEDPGKARPWLIEAKE